MVRRPDCKVALNCACGQVAIGAIGAPIVCAVCHRDDCQEGARQLKSLANGVSVEELEGGTAYLAFRKDRVRYLRGVALLRNFKIRENSATNRVLASCCNSPMYLGFDDGKHWLDMYRSRCTGDAFPVQMHICTKFVLAGNAVLADAPHYAGYPASFILKLLLSRAAMLVHRRREPT